MKKIGIDLGTTNSCVYYLDDAGTPVLVLGDRGTKFFSSAVWAAGRGKERVVGGKAKARMGSQPSPVIAVKRKMGTDEKVLLGGEPVGAVEVSTEILCHAKRLVEKATGDSVGCVVVTMPAYFDAAPRIDTKTAAVRAFFNGDEKAAEDALALHLEPEAAAYSYIAQDPAANLKILVYDLGGGTFDVTVMEKTEAAGIEVLKFGGDPHLGGDNVDDRLAMWILYLLRGGKETALVRVLGGDRYPVETRHTVLQQIISNDVAGLRGVIRPEDRDLLIPTAPRYDLELSAAVPEDLARIQTLKMLAENAKMDLTSQHDVVIVRQNAFSDHQGELVEVDVSIGRPEFNLLIGDMIAKSIAETLAVIGRAGMRPSDFDRVLLVGGSSRMPVVAEELQKLFTCPILLADPDLCVARGAAILAAGLRGPVGPGGGLTLDFPGRTRETAVNIAGKLASPVEDGQVYLMRAEDEEEEFNAAVDGDRFLLRGVRLNPESANRFHLDVLDGRERCVAEADLSIVHSLKDGSGGSGPAMKFTKPIRSLGKNGFKVLFDEGEPLPASKEEICYRASTSSTIRIPIFEGERRLRDLCIENVDPSVNVGAEILLRIHIGKDFRVSASATVTSTKQGADVEFQFEPIRMPTIEEMAEEKDKVLEEIENALGSVKDPNKMAQFKRSIRRLESDFTRASRAAEPDSHHLFSLIGELKKLKVEIENSQNFMHPPFEEFEGMIRVCRKLASELPPAAALKKEDVLRKVDGLHAAGKDAWEHENQMEWRQVVEETRKFIDQIRKAIDPPKSSPPPSPETILRVCLEWLDELAKEVRDKKLDPAFLKEIDALRAEVRGVNIENEEEGRRALMKIVSNKIKPLEKRVKGPDDHGDPAPEKKDLVNFQL